MQPALAAVILGAGGGLRSFAPPAVLAARGRGPFAGAARFIAFGAAVGELIADKQPGMGTRWAPRGLSLRLGFSATAGHELAGLDGAVLAGAVAVLAARVGSLARARVGQDANRHAALRAAILEDFLSYALVTLATHG